jgi:LacI family transcriptional regulator
MDIQTARERNRGFLQELSRTGIPSGDVIQIYGIRNEHEARSVTHEILDLAQPPTAIGAAQNLVTLGAIRARRERELHKRVALVGFDDTMLGDLLDPGVTVVTQNPQRIGELAAERALARMQGEDLPPETIIVPTTLIPRGSGGIPPYVD